MSRNSVSDDAEGIPQLYKVNKMSNEEMLINHLAILSLF